MYGCSSASIKGPGWSILGQRRAPRRLTFCTLPNFRWTESGLDGARANFVDYSSPFRTPQADFPLSFSCVQSGQALA